MLWAITPDGRPNNLGEVLPAGTKNNIDVTTALQSFGMIVTAEPYFSVTQPSDVVVLQNVILNDKTMGVLEKVNAHYLLLPRGTYAQTEGSKSVLNPITRDEKSPLELYQANNAVRIAQAAGADQYAPEIMKEAMQDLTNATAIDQSKKADRKMEITYARQSVQRAEDARLVTLRRQAAERQLASDTAKRDAQNQAQQSQLAAERARASQAEADADRARAEAAAAEAQARAAAANKSADNANAVREKLRAQLNSVLATSESARGLIVNMSDVLFDTGKYNAEAEHAAQPGEGLRNFAGLSGTETAGRGLHGQRRERGLQPEALGESGGRGSKFSARAGSPARQYHLDWLRRGEAGSGQCHSAGSRAEPSRPAGGFGRCDWSRAEQPQFSSYDSAVIYLFAK